MAYIVRDLPPITLTSSSSVLSIWTGLLDDATAIMVYLSSATNILSSNITVQVTPRDWAESTNIPIGVTATVTSTVGYVYTSQATLSSGVTAFTLTPIDFRSFRLNTSANTISSTMTIAYATKQIAV